jgi:hypothetical protein
MATYSSYERKRYQNLNVEMRDAQNIVIKFGGRAFEPFKFWMSRKSNHFKKHVFYSLKNEYVPHFIATSLSLQSPFVLFGEACADQSGRAV